MFARMLFKSFSKRKSRIAIAIVSVILGSSIASALLSTSLEINDKVSYEFRKFGSNILVVPKSDTIDVGIGNIGIGSITEQKYINETDLYKIKQITNFSANVLGFAPFLYQVVDINKNNQSQKVILAGTWFDKEVKEVVIEGKIWRTGIKRIATWWSVEGEWVEDNRSEDALIGINVAEKMNLKIGDKFNVKYKIEEINLTIEKNFTVKGILTTGNYEDNEIFTTLDIAQNLTLRENKVHTVQVSGLCNNCPAETIAWEIEQKIPNVKSTAIKQLANAEANIMKKLEEMMLLIVVATLSASALGVMTTMTTSVIERRKEIGLMKAIGAENKKVALLFLTEATLIGIIGGILGYLIGLFLAQFIGQSVFNSSISPRLIVVPIAIGISVGVSLLASALPVRRAIKIEPAIVLRGE